MKLPPSFRDELDKTAAFLPMLAKFFEKNIPSMVSGVQKAVGAAGLTGPVSSRIIGGIAGGTGGAYAGSRTGDETTKGRNTLIGGALGAAAGAIGMGKLAPKLKNVGSQMSKDFQGLGNFMNQPTATAANTAEYAAKHLTPQYGVVGKNAPTAKSFFGIGPETKATRQITNKPSLAGGAVGEAMKSLQTISQASNPVKGVGEVLKQNWKDLQTFNKDVGGKTYQFARSGVGKVVNPMMMSGVGFGATEALSSKNPDGSKRGVGERVLRGGGTALAWGAAPKLMVGKMMGYDIPRMAIGMKKSKQINES